jgi:hypothetical protein
MAGAAAVTAPPARLHAFMPPSSSDVRSPSPAQSSVKTMRVAGDTQSFP